MAVVLTIRLQSKTASLLRLGACMRNCDQKTILQQAIEAFSRRKAKFSLHKHQPTPDPGSADALLFWDKKFKRRSFDPPPQKLTTTISNDSLLLLKGIAGDYNLGDVVDRMILYYLWEDNRRDFRNLLYPKILDADWKTYLEK